MCHEQTATDQPSLTRESLKTLAVTSPSRGFAWGAGGGGVVGIVLGLLVRMGQPTGAAPTTLAGALDALGWEALAMVGLLTAIMSLLALGARTTPMEAPDDSNGRARWIEEAAQAEAFRRLPGILAPALPSATSAYLFVALVGSGGFAGWAIGVIVGVVFVLIPGWLWKVSADIKRALSPESAGTRTTG